jgi:hypothetical protein
MAKQDDRERTFTYRAPAGEGAKLRAELKARGLSFNALVTSLIFGQPLPRASRTPPVEKEMLATLLARSAAIRDALDEAAHRTPDNATASEAIKAACDELTVIRAALMKMMERAP